MRRLGRLASVVPVSPTNTISESKSSRNTAKVLVVSLTGCVRTPISAPFDRTRNGEGETGDRLTGSTVVTVQRASLLRKPVPALRYNSVFAHGPNTRPSFGLGMTPRSLPELAARLPETLEL